MTNSGRAEDSRAAYLEHKGQAIEGQGVWDEVIAKDFAGLEKARDDAPADGGDPAAAISGHPAAAEIA